MFVFLILAALYESWAFPLAVILVVPVCVACSLGAVWLTDPGSAYHTVAYWNADPDVPNWLKPGEWLLSAAKWIDDVPVKWLNKQIIGAGIAKQDVNIFTQVGFVVLVGLACKNAILIVEFAKKARDDGADVRTAVLEACKLRFRPIMMTSVAFMLGVLPLAVATGAGAEMRQALGVAVLGGMLGVTAFGVFLTPVFFAFVDRATHSSLAYHPWVMAVSEAGLFVLRMQFISPLAASLRKAAASSLRKATRNRFGA
jgi:multidrug efflux pump